MKHLIPTLIVLAPFALTGCSEQGSSNTAPNPQPAPQPAPSTAPSMTAQGQQVAPPSVPPATVSGQTINVAGFAFTAPDGWIPNPPSNMMRLAELHVANPAGDPSIAVFSAAGGDAQMNIDRWIGQFSNPSGNVVSAREQKTIAGQTVDIVEMSGEYHGMGMQPAQAETMMRAAIVEQPGGQHLFIKMTGPIDHMKTLTDGWNSLLDSMHKP